MPSLDRWRNMLAGAGAAPTMHAMLDRLRSGGIESERVLAAMSSVPREAFVTEATVADAYADRALSIGYRQTISQPFMVAVLVQALDLQDGDRVLDVGTGSGYQAAIMAACGAEVVTIERIPELATAAAARLERLGIAVEVHTGDGSLGLPACGPYDAIAVAAAAPAVPHQLVEQLKVGGRLVIPVHNPGGVDDLTRVRRDAASVRSERVGNKCVFVPLIGAAGYPPDGDG